MKNEASNKPKKIVLNIILVSILLITAKIFYDESHSNDYIGWLLLAIFWMFRSLYDFIENLRRGKKKLALLDLFLVTVGFGLLFWQSIKFLT
ncbi:hypothetical protein [Rossellomorea sp. BNER]|uniref:hypothetical protein n=1 Tax=Rossellomorea sp. BNER TaxID=2962031 RepID=UPI003AF2C6F5|nr:hypothetical protein [Rossellomorea sp. BNER]